MKRALLFFLALSLCVSSFLLPARAEGYQKYSRMELGIFDTEITLIGYCRSQQEFNEIADGTMAQLKELNRIFDAYNSYAGLNNLWYINHYADDAPVEVPSPLFDLLLWCKEKWDEGWRQNNIVLGAVLSIWHDYRTAGLDYPQTASLPPMEKLQAAYLHTDFDQVILDPEKQTVYFADPEISLDIGAVAKGYAADLVGDYLAEKMPSFLLSLGGNIRAGISPQDGRANWGVSIQDPDDPAGMLDVLYLHSLSVVTSGDYWRYYVVDGKRYHHIIDPDTLMPADYIQAVTVVCESGALADYLTTALFVMPYEEGRALIDSLSGVEALWSLKDGTIYMTDGLAAMTRSHGASSKE
ncbi:MAG: FAD:protein FMN transferase [Clostridiales bacterium]|nr:FAD:protein FMN transferase [Clostridiales bacterium]